MGFFEKAMNARDAFFSSNMGHETFRKLFQNGSDEQLIEWWNNRYNYDNIDDEIIEMAERELRRRGLYY
ncbi:MAG: hypothetical protein NC177_01510 [Ruminococcus flavefaciens]|nr:hypothetical protein [Ruminococcus flavefaciens]